ncbi:DUF7224 domain-containing protein [Streptomyces profundus]|uniref:DUF7224 domain-containing protein n=1 Tax=Streptomyces profundus TaxID=2867410 RepID=UPI001D164999|nr:hypothetical protein [Streptomyces sp. MA3_2.13]UED86292.1 hypothetical protein K4G22_20575 [Streptomyces sp. MA3_2.13]
MRLRTWLRASAALWLAPPALALIVLYFYGGYLADYRLGDPRLGYAPRTVSAVLLSVYPLIYATAAALGAWESGRLRRDGVWALGPARSRASLIAQALAPVWLLAGLMTGLAIGLALGHEGQAPTVVSLVLPGMAWALAVAHSLIGFAAGLVLPRIVVAPVLALVVFYAVAAAWSYEPFWLRHISGQYPGELGFGQLPTTASVGAPVLFAGAIALGLTLLTTPVWRPAWRVGCAVAGCLAMLGGTVGAYAMVRDWGHSPPTSTGHAQVRCAGDELPVCMPAATAGDLPTVRADIGETLRLLTDAGVAVEPPARVEDRLIAEGERAPDTWRLPLTSLHSADTTRLAVVDTVVVFPCAEPDGTTARTVMLWAAGVAGVADDYLRRQREELLVYQDGARILEEIEEQAVAVTELSPAEQADWYRNALAAACASGESAGVA